MNRITCTICEKSCKSLRSITAHIRTNHQKNSDEIKDILLRSNPELFRNCLFCNKKIRHYISDSQSRKCCDRECAYNLNRKKQSNETIKKRIENTDQLKKEKKRQETFIKKYNSLYAPKNPEERNKKISEKLKNKAHTEEHHKKIIESKRKNNTLNHSEETKKKISEKVKNTFRDPNYDKSKLIKNHTNNYRQGYYKNFYCRSSYEKLFVDFCEEYNITLVSAENKNFCVQYIDDDNVLRTYFPDFYLPDYDLVVEIKPLSMYDYKNNINKFDSICQKFKFIVITEEEYLLDIKNWNKLYEELNYHL